MKRYLVFRWDKYYPRGGWNDLLDSYDSKDQALAHLPAADDPDKGGHVVDSDTDEIVPRF